MYFIWDFASSIILFFEDTNKDIAKKYWEKLNIKPNPLKLKNLDNKAEVARSKMLLGNNYENPLKNTYFSILTLSLKIKIEIESNSLGNSRRGQRFIDFIKEDFDICSADRIFINKRLLPIFRKLRQTCELLIDKTYHQIDKKSIENLEKNELSKNYLNRHSGKKNFKDEIYIYLLNFDIEKIRKFNNEKIKRKNLKKSKIQDKYSSIPVFCNENYFELLEIFEKYQSSDKTKLTRFVDLALYEDPNYLKGNKNPDFVRIFRNWRKDNDQPFLEAIDRVVENRTKNQNISC